MRQPFGQGFYQHEGLLYCEQHFFEVAKIIRCAGCQQPIVGQCLTALGKQWHPDHFVCSLCTNPLAPDYKVNQKEDERGCRIKEKVKLENLKNESDMCIHSLSMIMSVGKRQQSLLSSMLSATLRNKLKQESFLSLSLSLSLYFVHSHDFILKMLTLRYSRYQ